MDAVLLWVALMVPCVAAVRLVGWLCLNRE